MQIYWSYHSIPELASLPEARRRAIWKRCRRRKTAGLWYWLVFVPIWVAIMYVIPDGRHPHLHNVIFAVWLYVLLFVGLQFKVARLRPEIQEQLSVVPYANCGYDLRATPELCPECGVVPSKVSRPSRPAYRPYL
jgi:hypothetical protein